MKTLQQFVQDIKHLETSTKNALNVAPKIIGNEVVKDIRRNFQYQRLKTDTGIEKWEPSKAAIRENRKTLIDSATLYNSIHYEIRVNRVFVGLDRGLVPYAEKHNEGKDGMVKRQFLYVRQSVLKKAMEKVEKLIKVPK